MIVHALLIASLLVAGCKKADENKTQEPQKTKVEQAAPASAVAGIRRVSIEAGQDGYSPDIIKGKPGEKLVLVFTRTVEGDCLAKVKMPGGQEIALPMNTPTDVSVTVPMSGRVEFACGMGMSKGVIVADPS